MRQVAKSSLLERLTDDEPDREREGATQPDITRARLRQSIVRDLSLLFNTSPLASSTDLNAYPEVSASTVNYGIDCRVGVELEAVDPSALRWEIALALQRFEPRFAQDSIEVSLVEESTTDSFQFRIEAELQVAPKPFRMVMRTEHDRRSNNVKVVELSRDER
jgi:type VI secretion system protein ImpF